GDGRAGAHRALPGQAGYRHQPAHALRDLVEAGTVAVGAVLAEARDAGEDDPRVQLLERLEVYAEAVLHVRAVVLDHHVGGLHQARQDLARLRDLEVERQRALVAVQVLHVRPVARPAHALVRVHARRRLDLDHVRAEV